MGYICDFCGRQRSVVYCRSDSACLCLCCDQHVHSANTLSQRHSRTLLCEKCNSQPAFLRCVEERTSFCQNCDWAHHGVSVSTHRRQTINCYTGCPSTDEFSTLWPFILEIPSMNETTCEHELGLMDISKDSFEECLPPPISNSGNDVSASVEPDDGRNVESGACLSSLQRSVVGTVDQPCGSARTTMPELCFSEANDPALCKVDTMFVDFNIDELDLNIENYEEIFGPALNRSEQSLQNGDIDGLFRTQHDLNADGVSQAAPSTCPTASVNEGQAVNNAAQPASSNAASVDSIMSSKTEPIACFPASQAHSGLSLSGLTGESSAGDYQDCVVSPMLLISEHAWCSPSSEPSFASVVRSTAVMRYKEKKAARKFDKRVRYASRKARADVRKRVKGRFVKAGEAYDYDPLAHTRSC